MTYLMNEGTQIGPYRLENQIGRGGMAEVWKAFNTGLHRYEALKFIAAHVSHDRDLAERFLTETRVVAGMSHPQYRHHLHGQPARRRARLLCDGTPRRAFAKSTRPVLSETERMARRTGMSSIRCASFRLRVSYAQADGD